jgi:serine/threonine protein phosphatase PrpC
MMEADSVRRSPQRSKLLNAMGDENTFQPRMQADEFPLQVGDKFLLCTDGLWERVEESEMEAALVDCATAEEWLRLLEQYVVARADSRQDNYSAIALWCKAPAQARNAERNSESAAPADSSSG